MRYIVRLIWDELRDRFKEADDISIEDVNHDARQYLTLFLEEGFDATMIAEMLEKHDVFEFYQTLKKNGAVLIDLLELFDDEPDFIREHFDTFVGYGVPVDEIVKKLASKGDGYIEENELLFFAKRGATPRLILKYVNKEGEFVTHPYLTEILTQLEKNGCDRETITSWLKSSEIMKIGSIVDDIVENKTSVWNTIVKPEQFVDRWIDYFGDQYVSGSCKLKDLPELVSYKQVVDHFSMGDIISMNYKRMYTFIDEFREAGGDPQIIADRFNKEIGRPKNDLQKEALLAMKDQGLDVKSKSKRASDKKKPE